MISQIQELKSKSFYYKQNKQLLHIASIRIPFFLSNTNKPTSLIAIPTNNYQLLSSKLIQKKDNDNGKFKTDLKQKNNQYNQFQSFHIDKQQIIYKSYFPSGSLKPHHTIIIFFNDIQTSIRFYHQYNNLPINNSLLDDKTSLSLDPPSQSQKQSKSLQIDINKLKLKAFYCKDVSNLSQLFFDPTKNYVSYPQNQDLKELINIVSKSIIVDGLALEETLKSKKIPLLSFLDHKSYSTQHIYYRWRVYSYLQGDGDKKFRNQSFYIMNGGTQFYPPHQRPDIKILNNKQRLYFTNLIGKLTTKKNRIQEAMTFCIYNASYACQICQILSIWIFQNPIPIFYLISDIFFNTATPVFKNLFAILLPKIIYFLKNKPLISMSILDLQKIKSILELWMSKYIYEDQYIKGLVFLLDFKETNLNQQIYLQNQQLNQQNQSKLAQLEVNCHTNGIPFFSKNTKLSEKILNEYQFKNIGVVINIPKIGAYDGQQLTQKEIAKIKTKSVKVYHCQKTLVGMLFQKKNIQQ